MGILDPFDPLRPPDYTVSPAYAPPPDYGPPPDTGPIQDFADAPVPRQASSDVITPPSDRSFGDNVRSAWAQAQQATRQHFTRPPQANAVPASSLAAPRTQVPTGAGIPQVEQSGPISRYAFPMQPEQAGRPVDPNIQARLDSVSARDAQADNQWRQQQGAGNRAAISAYELDQAKNEARHSRFRAQDGADMILAPENRDYDKQREVIIKAADADQQTVNALRGERNAALIDKDRPPQQSPINAFAISQEALNRNQLVNQREAGAGLDTELKKLSVEQQKELSSLIQQLGATADPKKQKELQDKILALQGKRPGEGKIVLIDVPTGDPLTPFRKVALDTERNVLLEGQGQQAPSQVSAAQIAEWKKLRPSEAEKEARNALAKEVPLDVVNQRLKDAGFPELK